MRYTREMAGRAWREAVKAANWETSDKLLVPVATQCVLAIVIWFGWEAAQQPPALWTRLLTAAGPFLIFPLLFVLKWLALPPELAKELAALTRPAGSAEPHAQELTAFLNKADQANKVKAIDDVLAFHSSNLRTFAKDFVAQRLRFSSDQPSATVRDVNEMKERVLGIYRDMNELREKQKRYPALSRILSTTPGKEGLLRDFELLRYALESAHVGLIHHHHNGVYRWLQDLEDWWRSVEKQMIELRTKLTGG